MVHLVCFEFTFFSTAFVAGYSFNAEIVKKSCNIVLPPTYLPDSLLDHPGGDGGLALTQGEGVEPLGHSTRLCQLQ